MSPLGRRELELERIDLAAPVPDPKDGHPPRRPQSEEKLWFQRQRMVQWLAPRMLLVSAAEVVLSGIFARFADKREIQGGLPPYWFDASGLERDGALWLDFASDTGDGFASTYAVASALTRPEIELGEHGALPRGRVLVLGGDEVYPSASWGAYRDRFVGPWTAAFPFAADPGESPHMFALPGNHDWYDGLTSYMRLFAQGGAIGGWRTAQSRSYFAIKLPHDWWLWGIDTQFDTYIDAPQLDYFEAVAKRLEPGGQKVILATAKPSWVRVRETRRAGDAMPQSWKTLAFFQRRLIEEHGGRLALTITGDLHHYCHYREAGAEPREHKLTAGGAGAYMSATHPTPAELSLPDHQGLTGSPEGRAKRYERVGAYPSVRDSRRLARGILWPPIVSHTPSFGLFNGGLYALLAFCFSLSLRDGGPDFGELADPPGVFELIGDSLGPLIFAPLVALVLLGGLVGFADVESRLRKLVYGLAHWLLHVAPLFAFTVLVLGWIAGDGADPPGPFISELGLAAAAFGFGFLWGPVGFALYCFGVHRADGRAHANEVFAAQSRRAGAHYKHFVRIRVGADGLEVFPIAVDGVPKRWPALAPDRGPESEWFDSSMLRLELVPGTEAPFRVE